MTMLTEKVEIALTPDLFRAWLDGIGNRECAFSARNGELCALGEYINGITGWEPILAVGPSNVFAAELHGSPPHALMRNDGLVCSLPDWARAFVRAHDRAKAPWEPVTLPEVYACLDEAGAA